jgi:hypothetical protein
MFRVSIVFLVMTVLLTSPAVSGRRSSYDGGLRSLGSFVHRRSETGAFRNSMSNITRTHMRPTGWGRRSGGTRFMPMSLLAEPDGMPTATVS